MEEHELLVHRTELPLEQAEGNERSESTVVVWELREWAN